MIRLLLPITIISVLFANADAAPPSSEGKKIEVRFLAESIPADHVQIAISAEGKLSEPFDLPINNLSQPQSTPSRDFTVWDVTKKVLLASVTLPQEGDSFVAILVPSPTGDYSPIVMQADDPSFGGGKICFLNLTEKVVLGSVGTAKFELAAGDKIIVSPEGAHAENFYDFELGVREQEGDRVLVQTRWPQDDQARCYVFFYVNPETKRIAYRAVDEFIGKAK